MNNTISQIKSQIQRQYAENPRILIDLSVRGERNRFQDAPAVITAVYSNIFTVDIDENGVTRKHAFQYADILTGNLAIKPTASVQN